MATEWDPGPLASNMLVRSFSDNLRERRPGDALTRGLATKIILDEHREDELAALRDQWNFFLLEGQEIAICSVPREEAVLLDQSRKLHSAWTKFCQTLPTNQQIEQVGSAPSLRFLFDSVARASATWQEDRGGKKTGQLKQVFANLCSVFKDHSKLLSVIPSNDKYVSLLTGSLSAIAQASTNHQQIASGVASSLEELSQNMAYWNRLITDHGNPTLLHRYILELYVVVFEFLTEVFKNWSKSSWKRFLTSFDERAFDKLFSERRDRMRSIEQRLQRLTDLEFRKGITEKMEKMEAGVHSILHSQQSTSLYQKNLLLTLGMDMQRLLSQRMGEQRLIIAESKDALAVSASLESGPSIEIPRLEPPNSLSLAAQEYPGMVTKACDPGKANHPISDVGHYYRDSILDVLEQLANEHSRYTQSLVDLTSQASQVMVDPRVQNRILLWNRDKFSQNLWIQGPHDVSNLSQNTLTAVCLAALSRQNDIPCIFYICRMDIHVANASMGSIHRTLLRDMIKSLIVQLALFLPERLVTELDLSSDRFESLQTDSLGIEDAVHMLQDLRSLIPRYIYCIIGGLQYLESRDDVEHTRDLRSVLYTLTSMHEGKDLASLPEEAERTHEKSKEMDDPLPVTKLFLTTDGYMDALARLAEKDRVEKIEYSDEAHEPTVGEAVRLSQTTEEFRD